MTRTPVELATIYIERVYENHEYELVREIFSDPMTRHDPNGVVVLSHDEQIARLEKYQASMGANFHNITIHGDHEFVTVVYDMYTTRGKPYEMCSIETWKVTDGLITDCWNSPYVEGKWGDPDRPETLEGRYSTPGIIKDRELLDPAWISSVLKHSGMVEVPRVEMLDIEQLTGGNACTTLRINIGYNQNPGSAPESLICKMTPDNPHMAMAIANNGSNRAESGAAQLLSGRDIVNVPELYFADVDDYGFYFTMVSEDLGLKGAQEGDQLNGIDSAGVEAACEQFNRLHAHFWQSPEIAKFDWLNSPAKSAATNADIYALGVAKARKFYGDLISDAQYQMIEEFTPHVADWFCYNNENLTLIHAEARAANILFCPTDTGGREAYFIDWQMVAEGDPTRDLAYFLGVSVDTQLRRELEEGVLERHCQAIQTVDNSYSIERAKENYRFNLLSGVWGAVATCHFAETEKMRQILFSWLPRSCAAVEDWDSMALVKQRLNLR